MRSAGTLRGLLHRAQALADGQSSAQLIGLGMLGRDLLGQPLRDMRHPTSQHSALSMWRQACSSWASAGCGPACAPCRHTGCPSHRAALHTFGAAHQQATTAAAASAARQARLRAQALARNASGTSGEQSLYLLAFVVAMVGLTYASVPLYRMFCQATGFGGTVQQGLTVEEKLRERAAAADAAVEAAAAQRRLTVSFNADVSDGMPWRFRPSQRSVTVRPGESTLAFYTAQNLSDQAIVGVSTYNVAPQQAGYYFNKIQCFCFEEQKLRPGEVVDMPVFFYIDPEFATDPKMKGIDHLTLSYTFFNVKEWEDAEAGDEEEHKAAA